MAGTRSVVRATAGAAVGVLVLALVAVGCSSTATLDQEATEQAVGRAVAAEVAPSVTATTCPDPIEQEQGATFDCTVTLKGVGKLGVEVRQVDDEGTLDVAPTAAVVSGERIESELRTALKEQFDRAFQVDCGGDGVEIREPDSTSTCKARDKTSRRTVTVSVVDVDGTLAFAVGKPAS